MEKYLAAAERVLEAAWPHSRPTAMPRPRGSSAVMSCPPCKPPIRWPAPAKRCGNSPAVLTAVRSPKPKLSDWSCC
jgi:hypothetical protein